MFEELDKVSEGKARRYHSALKKVEKDKALKDFKSGEASVLCSTKALNQGFDVPDAQVGIICGLDSKALQMIQRVGRLLRLSPNKVGEVIIFYVADSQEEKWLKNSVRNLSNIVWMDDISSYI
jgi:superfamily II DNA or RNA helicase